MLPMEVATLAEGPRLWPLRRCPTGTNPTCLPISGGEGARCDLSAAMIQVRDKSLGL